MRDDWKLIATTVASAVNNASQPESVFFFFLFISISLILFTLVTEMVQVLEVSG